MSGVAGSAAADPYDIVDYPSHALAQTHPDTLATLAAAYGLDAAPADRCRVLELGCGDGVNLLAMAATAPESRFLGIDLAGAPIARARAAAAGLGLANVEFRQLDVMRLDRAVGEFDYLIAHGLYSWVPEAVRERILAVCAGNLAANGVAYISYNAYPGCHLREATRGMMRWHVRGLDAPRQKIDESLALLRFIVSARPAGDPWRALIEKELAGLAEYGDGPMFHDDLAPTMTPCYFHEFAARAAAHSLQYLAEAEVQEMQEHVWPEPVRAALRSIGDRIDREQYLDFLKGRRFRQTLLCRAGIALRPPAPERMRPLSFATAARAVSPAPDLRGRGIEEFRGERGARVAIDLPVAKAALVRLADRWPATVGFEALLDLARAAAGSPAAREDDARDLATFLLATWSAGVVEAHRHPPRFALVPGERPQAGLLARAQAAAGALVTDLRHGTVRLEDALARRLLGLLDGTRDRAALTRELAAAVAAGEVSLPPDETAAGLAPEQRIAGELPRVLDRLARMALLIA